MIEIGLAKSIYAVPTWTRTVALVREHAALRAAVDWSSHDVAFVYACYRFTAKRRQYSDTSARCIDHATARLGEQFPEYDRNVAIDGCDMPAHWNGQRFYGYKLDMAVCPAADLPLAWNVPTARYDG